MSEIKNSLLDKPASEVQAAPAAPAPPKKVPNSLNTARRIHNMISVMFLVVMGLVYLAFLSPGFVEHFKEIWIVFGVTIVFVTSGIFVTVSVVFNKSNDFVAIAFLIYLTLSLAYYIVYLAASAGSTNAGLITAFMMAFVNIFYSVVYQISDEILQPTIGTITGVVASLVLAGILLLADLYVLEVTIEEVNWLAYGMIVFVAILYSIYIYCTVKGMAEGTKEAISSEDYVISAITVYLDFSLGLIIVVCRQICTLLAG